MFDNAGKAAACGSKAPGGAVDPKCLLPGTVFNQLTKDVILFSFICWIQL